MTKTAFRWLIELLVFAWFVFSVFASAVGVFKNDSPQLGLGVAVAAVVPIVLFFLWFVISPRFRDFVLSLDPRALTLAQTWRVVGFTFVVLYGFGVLPGLFALPAGWGDVTIGFTAPFAVWSLSNPGHRTSFILWQALGILDLVSAVSLGVTSPLIHPHGVGMTAMTVLPLSLIPTFLVPLLAIFHVICIAQARRWRESRIGALAPRGSGVVATVAAV
jgi:hypothetical protein